MVAGYYGKERREAKVPEMSEPGFMGLLGFMGGISDVPGTRMIDHALPLPGNGHGSGASVHTTKKNQLFFKNA